VVVVSSHIQLITAVCQIQYPRKNSGFW